MKSLAIEVHAGALSASDAARIGAQVEVELGRGNFTAAIEIVSRARAETAPENPRELPLSQTLLAPRTIGILESNLDVLYVGQLADLDDYEILSVREIGRFILGQIHAELERLGLRC
jgi:hypothetical protein